MTNSQSPRLAKKTVDDYSSYASMTRDGVTAKLADIANRIENNHEPCHKELQKLLSEPNTMTIIKNNKKIRKQFRELYDRSTQIMAMSLTALDVELINQIDPNELYKQSLKNPLPALIKEREYFNAVSKFIVEDILERESIDERTLAMEYWHEVAADRLQYGDMNMVFVINAAFTFSELWRLKATKEGLSQRGESIALYLSELLSDKNDFVVYREYRKAHRSDTPYFGRYITEIDRNQTKAKDIHVSQREHAGAYKVIADFRNRLKQIKNKMINFPVSDKLRSDIFALDHVNDMEKRNKYFEISLDLEPKDQTTQPSNIFTTFYPYPKIRQKTPLYPREEEQKAPSAGQQPAKQVSFIIDAAQAKLFLPLIKQLFPTDNIIVIDEIKNATSEQVKSEDVYFLNYYARDLLKNNQHHLDDETGVIGEPSLRSSDLMDEPPMRKVMAVIYLMMSDPKPFFKELNSETDSPIIENRIAMVVYFIEELNDDEFKKTYALINSLALSQSGEDISVKKIPKEILTFMQGENNRREEIAAKAAAVVATPDLQRRIILKMKSGRKNKPEQKATPAIPAAVAAAAAAAAPAVVPATVIPPAPAVAAATPIPVPPVIDTTTTTQLLETIRTFVDETKTKLVDLNTSYQALLTTIHTEPSDIDASKASYLLLQNEIKTIQGEIALKIGDIKNEKERIGILTFPGKDNLLMRLSEEESTLNDLIDGLDRQKNNAYIDMLRFFPEMQSSFPNKSDITNYISLLTQLKNDFRQIANIPRATDADSLGKRLAELNRVNDHLKKIPQTTIAMFKQAEFLSPEIKTALNLIDQFKPEKQKIFNAYSSLMETTEERIADALIAEKSESDLELQQLRSIRNEIRDIQAKDILRWHTEVLSTLDTTSEAGQRSKIASYSELATAIQYMLVDRFYQRSMPLSMEDWITTMHEYQQNGHVELANCIAIALITEPIQGVIRALPPGRNKDQLSRLSSLVEENRASYDQLQQRIESYRVEQASLSGTEVEQKPKQLFSTLFVPPDDLDAMLKVQVERVKQRWGGTAAAAEPLAEREGNLEKAKTYMAAQLKEPKAVRFSDDIAESEKVMQQADQLMKSKYTQFVDNVGKLTNLAGATNPSLDEIKASYAELQAEIRTTDAEITDTLGRIYKEQGRLSKNQPIDRELIEQLERKADELRAYREQYKTNATPLLQAAKQSISQFIVDHFNLTKEAALLQLEPAIIAPQGRAFVVAAQSPQKLKPVRSFVVQRENPVKVNAAVAPAIAPSPAEIASPVPPPVVTSAAATPPSASAPQAGPIPIPLAAPAPLAGPIPTPPARVPIAPVAPKPIPPAKPTPSIFTTEPSAEAIAEAARLPALIPGGEEFRMIQRELDKSFTAQIKRFKESTELALAEKLDSPMDATQKATLGIEVRLLRYQIALQKMKQSPSHFVLDKQIGIAKEDRLANVQHLQSEIKKIQDNIKAIEAIPENERRTPYYSKSEKEAEIVTDHEEAMKRVQAFLRQDPSDSSALAEAAAIMQGPPNARAIRGTEKGENAGVRCIYHETKIPTSKKESVVARSVIVQTEKSGRGVKSELYTDKNSALTTQESSIAKKISNTIFGGSSIPQDHVIIDAVTFVDNHLKRHEGKRDPLSNLPVDADGKPMQFNLRVNTASPEMVKAITLAFIHRGLPPPTIYPSSMQVKVTSTQEKAFAKRMIDLASKGSLTLEQQLGSKQAEKEKKAVTPQTTLKHT